jgi:hypothetical protein
VFDIPPDPEQEAGLDAAADCLTMRVIWSPQALRLAKGRL